MNDSVHLGELTRDEVEKKIQAQLNDLVKLPLVGSAEFFVGFVRAFESLGLVTPQVAQACIEKGSAAVYRALAEKGTE